MKKDLKHMIIEHRKRGWMVEKTNGGHYCFRGPNGELAYTSSTPSGWRFLRNFKAQINRAKRSTV